MLRTPLILLIAGLLAAGCGSDEPSAAGSSDDRDSGRLKLEQCLRDAGIELPEGGDGPPMRAADTDELREAMEGPCKDEREAAFGDISAEDRQEMQDARVKFTTCMREQGIDIPDFEPGQGPPAAATQRIDRDDPKVQAAMEKCSDQLPRGGGRFGPPGGER